MKTIAALQQPLVVPTVSLMPGTPPTLAKLRENLNALGVTDAQMDIGVPFFGLKNAPINLWFAHNGRLEPEEIYQAFLNLVDQSQTKVLDRENSQSKNLIEQVENLAGTFEIELPFSTLIPGGKSNPSHYGLQETQVRFYNSLEKIRQSAGSQESLTREIYRHFFGKPDQSSDLSPLGITYAFRADSQPLALGLTPLEAYANKTAICFETAGLLYAALKAVGITDVEFCEAKTLRSGTPLPERHSVARVRLTGGQTLVMDPSVEITQTEELEGFDSQHYARLDAYTLGSVIAEHYTNRLGLEQQRATMEIVAPRTLAPFWAVSDSYGSVISFTASCLAMNQSSLAASAYLAYLDQASFSPEQMRIVAQARYDVAQMIGPQLLASSRSELGEHVAFLIHLQDVLDSQTQSPTLRLDRTGNNVFLLSRCAKSLLIGSDREADLVTADRLFQLALDQLPVAEGIALGTDQDRIDLLIYRFQALLMQNPVQSARYLLEAVQIDPLSCYQNSIMQILVSNILSPESFPADALPLLRAAIAQMFQGILLATFPRDTLKDLNDVLDYFDRLQYAGPIVNSIKAYVAEKRGDHKNADEQLELALQTQPIHPFLQIAEILFLERQSHYAEAREKVKTLDTGFKSCAFVRAIEARLAFATGQMGDAPLLAELQERQPAENYEYKGLDAFYRGDLKEAQENFERAAKDPLYSGAYRVQQSLGRIFEARADHHRQAGEKQAASRALENARAHYRNALEILPALEPARSRLSALE